jgi:hypothetical protein
MIHQNATAATPAGLFPYFRVRGITTVPAFVSPTIAQIPVPKRWRTKSLSFGIEATSLTHYAMSVAPTGEEKERVIIGHGNGLGLTWGFTGMSSFAARVFESLTNIVNRCIARCLCYY